jgi:hypothetical protein
VFTNLFEMVVEQLLAQVAVVEQHLDVVVAAF